MRDDPGYLEKWRKREQMEISDVLRRWGAKRTGVDGVKVYKLPDHVRDRKPSDLELRRRTLVEGSQLRLAGTVEGVK